MKFTYNSPFIWSVMTPSNSLSIFRPMSISDTKYVHATPINILTVDLHIIDTNKFEPWKLQL